jgi:hypothetical protein
LVAKVAAYLRPKCHALLLDATINSPTTVRLNIYQAFMLAAMKLHWYGRHMAAGPQARPRVFLTAIHAAISYMGAQPLLLAGSGRHRRRRRRCCRRLCC